MKPSTGIVRRVEVGKEFALYIMVNGDVLSIVGGGIDIGLPINDVLNIINEYRGNPTLANNCGEADPESEDEQDVVPDSETKPEPEKKLKVVKDEEIAVEDEKSDEWDMPEPKGKKGKGKPAAAKPAAPAKEETAKPAPAGKKQAKALPEVTEDEEDIEVEDEDAKAPSLGDACIDLQRECETEEEEALFEKSFMELLKNRGARSVVDVKDPDKFLAELKKKLGK